MTIFGKILIFFNLLAAGAFAYLATQDWQGRQTITASGVRHVIIVFGLPLGDEPGAPTTLPADPEAEIPFRVPLAGGFETKTVSKPLLEAFFKIAPGNSADPNRDPALPTLGGGAVPNQIAEVKRVKGLIDGALGGATSPAARMKMLAAWMQYQPETYEERVAVLKMIAAGDADGLAKALDARFAAVLEAPRPLDAEATTPAEDDPAKQKEKVEKVDASRLAPIDETERRARIAHLLMHLDQEAEWQKRVAVVVGLRRYVSAIVAQSRHFLEMAERVRQEIPADQRDYLSQERALLRLAIDRTDLANRQAELKLKWIEQEKQEADFVGQRTTQLKDLQARLAKIKGEVDELLTRQGIIEAAMFEVQREVAVTLDEVYRLEAALEARERELLKLAPKGGK
jgi:hypothetical protein